MNRRFLIDAFGWGIGLWLLGYVLGIVLFAFVPIPLIGWIITPFAAILTVWVAFTRLHGTTVEYFVLIAAAWFLIAAVGDYLFIVKSFEPVDGYYKPDVFLYYALTVAIPLLVGLIKTSRKWQPH